MEDKVFVNEDVIKAFDIDLSEYEGMTVKECYEEVRVRATNLSLKLGKSCSAVTEALAHAFLDKCVEENFRFSNDPRAWFNDGE